MSTIISSLLFFFFFSFCMSMHTCNARHPGVLMDANNSSPKKNLFSTKVLESVRQLNKDHPISVQEEGSSGDGGIFHESNAVEPKDSDSLLREISAAPAPMKPLVSDFSGRVPRRNLDERSGFFSDYSRPRTRPPSHN